jgi:triacylglycerol lipase
VSIFFLILAIFIALLLSGILITYTFSWVVHAGREPALMDTRFERSSLLLAARLVGMETFYYFLTLVTFPLGFLPQKKVRHREPVESARTPVLLLHGLFYNRACWWWIRRALRRRGVGAVHTMNVPMWRHPDLATEAVARKVDELCIAFGSERIHIVGHSMGGVVARHYIQLREGAGKVATCILLGSPNAGSILAPLAISPMGKELVPGSDLLREIARAPLPEDVRFLAIYSRHDNLVIPYESGRMEGIRNVELQGVGHAGLLYHPEAIRTIVEELTEKRR